MITQAASPLPADDLGGSFPITAYQIRETRPAFRAMTLCEDANGRIYAGGMSGVHRFDGTRWERIFDTDTVKLVANKQGDVYVSCKNSVFRFRADQLYRPDAVTIFEDLYPDDKAPLTTFQDASLVGDSVYLTSTNTIARLRKTPDGGDDTRVWRSRDEVPQEYKFRRVREVAGRPVVLLEGRQNYRKTRLAKITDDEQIELLPELIDEATGQSLDIGVIDFQELDANRQPSDQPAIVLHNTRRVLIATDSAARDITPAIFDKFNTQILKADSLPSGGVALLVRGVGCVILNSQGQVENIVSAARLPAFWTASFVDSAGRIWIPGENAIHRIDYQRNKMFWQVPQGELVYSIAFVGEEHIVVGTNAGAYRATLIDSAPADEEKLGILKPGEFQSLGNFLGRTKDLLVMGDKVLLATLNGIFSWDSVSPSKPPELVVEGAYHNILQGNSADELYAFGIWRVASTELRLENGKWIEKRSLGTERPTEDPVKDADGNIWAIGVRMDAPRRKLHRIFSDGSPTQNMAGSWMPVVFEGRPYAVVDTGEFPDFYQIDPASNKLQKDKEFHQLLNNRLGKRWMGSVLEQCTSPDGDLLVSTDRESVLRIARKANGKLTMESVFAGFAAGLGRTPTIGPRGHVWAGIRDAIYMSAEEQTTSSQPERKHEIWLSSLSLRDAAISPEEPQQLRINHSENGQMNAELDFQSSTLAIAFGIPNAAYPEQVTYRTRMIGVSDTWSELTFETTREFPGLRWGDYRFEVVATLADGSESQPASLELRVHPPWYRTIRAYSIFAAVGILGIGLFLRWKSAFKHQQVEALQREVNERINAEEQLLASQKELVGRERIRALGEMAAGVAHDMNNALTPIMAFSGILSSDMAIEDSKRRELAELIGKSAEDAAQMIRRLSPLYRSTKEQHVLTDLSELVRDVVQSLGGSISDSGRQIDFIVDCEKIDALVSPSDIREVLANLIVNAIDAIEHSGTIQLTSRIEGSDAILEVTDTGRGMTRQERERCFDTFFSSKGERGTGLGLPVCLTILRSYSGTMNVRSKIGVGTTILVRLPLDSKTPTATAELSAPDAEPLHILLVEDVDSTRRSVRLLLDAMQHNVIDVADAELGLTAIQNIEFDLLLTDHHLPGMSGYELCKRVKLSCPHVPTVLMSGREEPGLNEVCDYFLPKPISIESLRKAIQLAIHNCPNTPAKTSSGDTISKQTAPNPSQD